MSVRSFDEYRSMTEEALVSSLRAIGSIPTQLLDAMSYSLSAGGKRLRPVLMLAACELAGGRAEEALPYACALEMIHTYSLIHDDLPAMDNDDLRRGKPTSHRVFGEGMAVLAGDGLLHAAMELMLKTAMDTQNMRGVQAAWTIAKHSGVTGMVAGQTADVTGEGKQPTEELVTYIHTHKTADLFMAAMEAGVLLAGGDPEAVQSGSLYGLHLGVAFQIEDDMLDVAGDEALMGKRVHSDEAEGKLTWVALHGIEEARRSAEMHAELAVKALERWGDAAEQFRRLAIESVERKN